MPDAYASHFRVFVRPDSSGLRAVSAQTKHRLNQRIDGVFLKDKIEVNQAGLSWHPRLTNRLRSKKGCRIWATPRQLIHNNAFADPDMNSG
ncbi:hypothetical protein [Mangrovibacterium diazotrophicum]|uniref:hypothetical protein n=1 Tax=Mangrovibacterium diazotrophicum TaxID=1261403 RepID=UPI000E759F65|nr:hypothetical protein [Mangrovibacterium diazotrophicum]